MQKCYLNMHRYKAFLKVVEVGSFTKAAELLGYTQPALSQMMTSLERELSMKLLYRSRYGIRLTPEGERRFFIKVKLNLKSVDVESPVFGISVHSQEAEEAKLKAQQQRKQREAL